jgi:prefoldin subunit 5
MSEFCVKCCEKEAQIELLRKQIWELQQQVDALSFDLAFYEGKITNLSCNNK